MTYLLTQTVTDTKRFDQISQPDHLETTKKSGTGFSPTALALLLLIMVVAGCKSTPVVPRVLATGTSITMYYTNTFQEDYTSYQAAFRSNNTNNATAMRNMMVGRILLEIESNYKDFETKLFDGRAQFETWSDIAELGLAAATTITVGERSKTVLAAILTATKGGRLSVDKNFFREKATETIIASMQAERAKKMVVIQTNLVGNAMEYTLEAAMVDLTDYFYAGTLESGIQGLVEETGKQASNAKASAREASANRAAHYKLYAVTEEQINKRVIMHDKIGELKGNGEAGLPATQELAKAWGIEVKQGDDIYTLLDKKLKAAQKTGNDAVESLWNSFIKLYPQP